MAPKSTASKGKVPHHLVALSSAAVLAIYTVGYQRTRTAAEELDAAMERRPVAPVPMPSAALAPAAPLAADGAMTGSAAVAHSPVLSPAIAAAPVSPTTATPAPARTATATVVAPVATISLPSTPTVEVIPSSESAGPVEATTAPAAAAPAPPAAPAPAAPAPALTQYRDGTYHAWGRSRHGDVYAFVVIERGRIVHSGYDKCQTRWSCTLIDHLGPQVVKRQSAEVDFVSGATESGNAFYWGVVEALAKAKLDAPVQPPVESPVEAP